MAGPASLTPGPASGQAPLPLAFVPNTPAFDPLDRLPKGTPQDRLRQLRQHSADLHALIPRFETIREASTAKQEAASAHRRLVSHQQTGGFNLRPDHPSVAQALKTLERAEGELQRVQARQTERSQAWQASGAVLANVEGWLRQGVPGNCTLEPAVIEPPKLAKNETLLDALDRVRRRGREIKASLHTVRSAPWPSAHVKRRVREIVERLAREPDVSLLLEHDTDLSWPSTSHRAEVLGGETRALAFHETTDALSLIAWLLPDQLTKKLHALVDESADDAAAMSTEQRQTAEAELLGDSLAQDRIESEIVWLLMAQGGNVEHRSDVAPQAILGVHLKTNTPNGMPPTTSPLVWDVVRPGGGR
jgi:hypothetical protein